MSFFHCIEFLWWRERRRDGNAPTLPRSFASVASLPKIFHSFSGLRSLFCGSNFAHSSHHSPISAFYVSSIFTRFPSATVLRLRHPRRRRVRNCFRCRNDGRRRERENERFLLHVLVRCVFGHMGKSDGESVIEIKGVSVTDATWLLITKGKST